VYRIATFIPGLGVGGAEIALLRLIESTRDRARHLVVSFKDDNYLTSAFRSAGAEVVQFNLNPRNAFRVMARLREFSPDAVVGQMYYGCCLALFVSRLMKSRPRLIFSIHHSIDNLAKEKLVLRSAIWATVKLSAFADCAHFVAKRAAEQHRRLGLANRHIAIVPNGVDFSSWLFDAGERLRLRESLGFVRNDFIFGHMARYHPMKDHATLLRALELALRENPRIGAIICGRGTDKLVLPPPLQGRVRVLGMRRDMPAVMSACDAGVVSSSFGDAIPTVIWEFFGCRRLCVATDVGDCADMVRSDELIAPPGNPERLAAAMVRLSRKPAAELITEGADARTRAIESVDLRTVAGRMLSLWTGKASSRPEESRLPAIR
jgi:glycosyltransferase involved in cell wall biosynthesis